MLQRRGMKKIPEKLARIDVYFWLFFRFQNIITAMSNTRQIPTIKTNFRNYSIPKEKFVRRAEEGGNKGTRHSFSSSVLPNPYFLSL
jgi:hypothetical protein